MKTLAGKLTISRAYGENEMPISITLQDGGSHTKVVGIRLSLTSFAEALMGLGFVDCKFEYNDTGTVGKICEHKQEHVPYTSMNVACDYKDRLLIANEAIKPFEVDGWIGRPDDYLNHHNRKGGYVLVSFVRFVDSKDELVAQAQELGMGYESGSLPGYVRVPPESVRDSTQSGDQLRSLITPYHLKGP